MEENVARYTGDLSHDRQPFYYYAINFPLSFIPWSFVFYPAILSLWPERAKIRNGPNLFLFLWFSSIFLFFQFSGSRHSHYLFPIFPPAALALGVYLRRLAASDGPVLLWTRRLIFLYCFLVGLVSISAP
jgi:4-amino-4-deoxy-L-arabinose transferase-like glycosyltransferase